MPITNEPWLAVRVIKWRGYLGASVIRARHHLLGGSRSLTLPSSSRLESSYEQIFSQGTPNYAATTIATLTRLNNNSPGFLPFGSSCLLRADELLSFWLLQSSPFVNCNHSFFKAKLMRPIVLASSSSSFTSQLADARAPNMMPTNMLACLLVRR